MFTNHLTVFPIYLKFFATVWKIQYHFHCEIQYDIYWLLYDTKLSGLITHSCVKELHLPGGKTDNTDGNQSNINIVDNDGHTAFHLACLNGHLPIVDYLCTCGANLEAWYVNIHLLLT